MTDIPVDIRATTVEGFASFAERSDDPSLAAMLRALRSALTDEQAGNKVLDDALNAALKERDEAFEQVDELRRSLTASESRVKELERQLEDEKWESKQHKNAADLLRRRERIRIDGDCPENATLLTNVVTERLCGWLDYNRFDVMREAVRLYGEHFRVRLSEDAYDRSGNRIGGALALHRTHRGWYDLSAFWRCHEAIAMECAKA
jgi:hypothetical protein